MSLMMYLFNCVAEKNILPIVPLIASSIGAIETSLVVAAATAESDHIFMSSSNNADYIDNICGGIGVEESIADGISTWVTRNSNGEIEANRNSDEMNRKDLEKSLESLQLEKRGEDQQEINQSVASNLSSGNYYILL